MEPEDDSAPIIADAFDGSESFEVFELLSNADSKYHDYVIITPVQPKGGTVCLFFWEWINQNGNYKDDN